MKKITVLLSLLCCASAITAQRHEILDRQLHTLQVVVNDDPLLPPIMNLGGGNHLEIGFDEFSHEYHRYIYNGGIRVRTRRNRFPDDSLPPSS